MEETMYSLNKEDPADVAPLNTAETAPLFPEDDEAGFNHYYVSGAILAATTGSFMLGYSIAVFNTMIVPISIDMKWTDGSAAHLSKPLWQSKVLTYLLFVGAGLGSALGCKILDRGRRFALLLMHFLYITGYSLMAIAFIEFFIFFGRFLTGIATGLCCCVVPVYISEIVPKVSGGFYGLSMQLSILIGILVAITSGLFLEPLELDENTQSYSEFNSFWWKFVLIFGMVAPILGVFLLSRFYPLETPLFLVQTRKYEACKGILKKIYGVENISHHFIVVAHEARQPGNARMGITAFFSSNPEFRRTMIVGVTLAAFTQLSGINVFNTTSNSLFMQIGLNTKEATLASTFLMIMSIFAIVPAAFTVDKWGRRSVLLMGISLQVLSLLPAAIAFTCCEDSAFTTLLGLLCTASFIVSFGLALGPVPFVYLGEVYPEGVKAVAIGLSYAAMWLASFGISALTSYLPTPQVYPTFLATNVLALFFTYFYVAETKNVRKFNPSSANTELEAWSLED